MRQISYETYCRIGALRNPHTTKIEGPRKTYYYWTAPGPCYHSVSALPAGPREAKR